MTSEKNFPPEIVSSEVTVRAGHVTLAGTLSVPARPIGIVLFAHGSGSSRHSPRNMYVAGVLHSRRIATLLFDLLTTEEESKDRISAAFRFNIPLLSRRLVDATKWVERHLDSRGLPICYFGASTGAAAALVAAAELADNVKAIVSRGGRPDLAGAALDGLRVPTLLIVGENDRRVIDTNREALVRIAGRESKIVIVPGATHLFEEPGALEEVASIAADWFHQHLAPSCQPNEDAYAHR